MEKINVENQHTIKPIENDIQKQKHTKTSDGSMMDKD